MSTMFGGVPTFLVMGVVGKIGYDALIVKGSPMVLTSPSFYQTEMSSLSSTPWAWAGALGGSFAIMLGPARQFQGDFPLWGMCLIGAGAGTWVGYYLPGKLMSK